jgi:hypothetical protein
MHSECLWRKEKPWGEFPLLPKGLFEIIIQFSYLTNLFPGILDGVMRTTPAIDIYLSIGEHNRKNFSYLCSQRMLLTLVQRQIVSVHDPSSDLCCPKNMPGEFIDLLSDVYFFY